MQITTVRSGNLGGGDWTDDRSLRIVLSHFIEKNLLSEAQILLDLGNMLLSHYMVI